MNQKMAGMYGRGWAFPPDFDIEQGAQMVMDIDDIQQSLRILFSTQLNERIMRPTYGCDLHSAIFENINDDLFASIRTNITDSVLRYEQRVSLESIKIERDRDEPGCLHIQVACRIRGTEAVMRLAGQLDVGGDRGGVFI